jgi:fatty acid desaturase
MDMTRLANALRYFLLPEDSILTRPEAQCFAGSAASTCKTVLWIALALGLGFLLARLN